MILNIYRSPGPATAFFSELQDILSYISTLPHDLALMGDFNLRIDSSSSDAGRLSGILDSFNLHQYVDFPTHIDGHSLDLMIFSSGCNVLSVSALILFRTTFLLLLTCKFHPIIVGPSHKLSSTESYNQSTWKPSRLISQILI